MPTINPQLSILNQKQGCPYKNSHKLHCFIPTLSSLFFFFFFFFFSFLQEFFFLSRIRSSFFFSFFWRNKAMSNSAYIYNQLNSHAFSISALNHVEDMSTININSSINIKIKWQSITNKNLSTYGFKGWRSWTKWEWLKMGLKQRKGLKLKRGKQWINRKGG